MLSDSREFLSYLWERSGSRSLRWHSALEPDDALATKLEAWATSWQASPRISVCIPSKDRLDLLVPCLVSLAETSAGGPIEVVIGDTGSSPRTLKFYAEIGLPVIRIPGPFNYSRACNELAGAATGDQLLFVNNDTEAISSDWLDRLLKTPTTTVAGATLVYPRSRRVQHAGVRAVSGRRWLHPNSYGWRSGSPVALENIGVGKRLVELPRRETSVMAVNGAVLHTSRSQFEACGGFDESYRVDLQDTDYCLRCWRLGSRVVCRHDVVFAHRHAATRGRYAFPSDDWDRFLERWQDDLRRWASRDASPVATLSR